MTAEEARRAAQRVYLAACRVDAAAGDPAAPYMVQALEAQLDGTPIDYDDDDEDGES